jgi:hypothetical protein
LLGTPCRRSQHHIRCTSTSWFSWAMPLNISTLL